MTAGPDVIRRSGPGQKHAIDNALARVGWGTQNKTSFNAAKRRASKVVAARYDAKFAAMMAAGDPAEVGRLQRCKADDVALLRKITQHWFRYKFATDVGRQDPIAAKRQGGWRDTRSLLGYLIEDAEYQRNLIEQRGAPGTKLTQRGGERWLQVAVTT